MRFRPGQLTRLAAAALAPVVGTGHAREPDERLLSMPPGAAPVVVRASFDLRDVNAINDQDETVEFAGTLTLGWHDPRQAFDPADAGVREKLYHGDFQFNEVSPGWYPQVVLANESGVFESHGVLQRIRPDGSCSLVVPVNAVAEIELDMRLFPFDRQQLELAFQLVGFNPDEVVLEAMPPPPPGIRISQWNFHEVTNSTRLYPSSAGQVSEFVVTLHVERDSVFILRLVGLPLVLIVALSWSVFWMDRSSLGDRLNVSFVGILTAVAFQLVVGDLLPHVSYITLMHAFLNVSFLVMCAGVVMNLVVSADEKGGRSERGHRLDRCCRWLFPASYVVLLLLAVVVVQLVPQVA